MIIQKTPTVSRCHYSVLYGDTDQMGIVYHVNYLKYMEIGRVEYLRDQGWVYRDMEASGIRIPVLNVNVDYKAPAFYDDKLDIETRLKKLTRVRIEFDYEIYRNDDRKLLVTGSTSHVFAGNDNKPKRVDQSVLDRIEKGTET